MKILIIGAGASGLMAGALLSRKNFDVTIIDGNEKCGKKIFITGKGRCNLTNNCSKEDFLNNVVHGDKFMMSAINQFSPSDTMSFFIEEGLDIKTERGGRVFPSSDKSSDVIKTLVKACSKCKILLNERVLFIDNQDDKFYIKTEKNEYFFDKVIVATGGKSYPGTGSRGDGYKFAKMFNISVTDLSSGLVPIKLKDDYIPSLEGLSLKNVLLSAKIDKNSKQFFGEMLFTHDAISGPIALSMSSYLKNNGGIELSIDFKPALTKEQLQNRILKEFSNNLNKNISYIMKGLLPKRLIPIFLTKVEINPETKINSITVEKRNKIIQVLKMFKLNFDSLYPVECGIITRGGVDLKEINPKTMESKKIKNLYFIGEVLDIDCLTGGYNLQTAFSTAFACSNNIVL